MVALCRGGMVGTSSMGAWSCVQQSYRTVKQKLKEKMRGAWSNFDQSVGNLITRPFSRSTADDALAGAFFDRQGLYMVNEWHPSQSAAGVGNALDRQYRAWKVSTVGAHVSHHIEANTGGGFKSRADISVVVDYLPITGSHTQLSPWRTPRSGCPTSGRTSSNIREDLTGQQYEQVAPDTHTSESLHSPAAWQDILFTLPIFPEAPPEDFPLSHLPCFGPTIRR